MNSLHPLTDRQRLTELNGNYYGKIPPEKTYKRAKAVIFQEYCLTTELRYDVMISWLQKAIRRGREQEAWYVTAHLANMRGIFFSNLLNRLMVILSEDIGPAAPEIAQKLYPLYRNIKENRPKTGVLRDVETVTPQMQQDLWDIVMVLSGARKSRIADWLIHSVGRQEEPIEDQEWIDPLDEDVDREEDDDYEYEDYDDSEDPNWEPLEDTLENFRYLCMDAVPSLEVAQEAMRVLVDVSGRKDKLKWGTCRDPAKRRPVWLFWEKLLEFYPCLEMQALYGLYEARDDLLHLAHALCLVIYRGNLPSAPSPSSQSSTNLSIKDRWAAAFSKQLPVLNDAFDVHTLEGRNLLGRDFLFFLRRGAHLENHYPFPGEEEMVAELIREEEGKEDNFAEKEPRDYQKPIVAATKAYFASGKNEGTLAMACGTGKTLTSFWVVRDQVLAIKGAMKLLVVTPRLQVLGQFYRTYRDSFIQHGMKAVVGVICSDFSRPKPDDLCYHVHIRNVEELVDFWKRYIQSDDHGYDVVGMFTTYASLKKIRSLTTLENRDPSTPLWDLVVYDEAHHMHTLKHSLSSRCRLLLSATPRGDQAVIYRYGYEDAIGDGALAPYKLHVVPLSKAKGDPSMPEPSPQLIPKLVSSTKVVVEDSLELIGHYLKKGLFKKLIVFSNKNARSFELFREFRKLYPDITSLYIDHTTKMKDREPITRQWVQAECGVFFNCSILGEGVDFPSVDAIYLESGHMSQTRVIQAAGRPLRKDPKRPNKQAHIIMSYGNKKEYQKAMSRLDHLVR